MSEKIRLWKQVAKQLDSHIKSYKNLTVESETAKKSLIDNEFGANEGTLCGFLSKRLDMKVVGSVKKRHITSNYTNKTPPSKKQRLSSIDTLKKAL